MDNIGHKIVDIIDDYTELFSDTPDFNHVETLSQNICLMQITQAMPEAFGRDVIHSCPLDDIPGDKFGCHNCLTEFIRGWKEGRTSNQIQKALVSWYNKKE